MRTALPCAVLGFLLVGCSGPGTVPVTCKVVGKGATVQIGGVTFHPDPANPALKENPTGLIQPDGAVVMKTPGVGDGVPPGHYKVTLTAAAATRLKRPEYGDPGKTPWAVDVPAGGLRDHVFEVK